MITPESQARREWAAAMLRRCEGPWPSYGTPEWVALPEGSPAKVAAVVSAAEAWKHGDDMDEIQAAAEARWNNYLHAEAVAEHRAEYDKKSYKPHPSNREVA